MTKTVSWLLLGLCAAIAFGGYFQVYYSPFMWCGRGQAYPGTTVLAVLCLAQTALYLATAASPRWAIVYRISQFLIMPFVAYGLFQVFSPHPLTVMYFAVVAAIPVLLGVWLPGWSGMRRHMPAMSGLFVTSVLVFLVGFGQIPLTLPGVIATNWVIALAAVSAIGVSTAVIGSVRRGLPQTGRMLPDIARYLPLALLLFPILRAKLPDVAYDSYMYKTTLPYQIAEWRTGDMAIIDGFLIGTNLQELLNGLLVAIMRDYLPPFISTISFVLLFLITPLAFPVERRSSAVGRAVVAFAGVSAFVVSEAGTAQGTSYQEALLLLCLVASLIRCPMWPAFIAAAIGVKISALFIAPVILLYHVFAYRGFFVSPQRLLIGVLTGMIVLLPQFNRNMIFSGRILGLSETLSAVTDPPGPSRIMVHGETPYDQQIRGGILHNAVLSTCNILALDVVCPTADQKDPVGFLPFPSSRAPLFALVFAVAVVIGACVHRKRRMVGLISAVAFVACYAGFLIFMEQGRYFLPLSVGFSVMLLINAEQAEDTVLAMGSSRLGGLLAVTMACWLVGSSLLPGTFTNVSWVCYREIRTAARTLDMREPENPLQTFVASYIAQYKRTCPPPGLSPVILSEHDVLNSPYLGAHRIFHVYTQDMITRFFAANPIRQARAADAILAIVSKTSGYDAFMLGPAQKNFEPCYHDDKAQVMCSTVLAPVGHQCATSLYSEK